MESLYDFSWILEEYESEFTAITLSNGYYDDSGEWIKGDTVTTKLKGAIISHSDNKIFRSEGALTQKDKRLFMQKPIDSKLHGAKIVYEGDAYSLTDCKDNAKFTGVYAYTLKYVSAFKDITPDYDLTEDLERLEKRLDGILEESTVEPETDVNLADKIESIEQKLNELEGDNQ